MVFNTVSDFLSTLLTFILVRREMKHLNQMQKARHRELVKAKIEGRITEEEEIELKAKVSD